MSRARPTMPAIERAPNWKNTPSGDGRTPIGPVLAAREPAHSNTEALRFRSRRALRWCGAGYVNTPWTFLMPRCEVLKGTAGEALD